MQVQAHHNSEPFIVKAVNVYALQNVQYLIKRAELELEIKVKKVSQTLKVDNKTKEVHTFYLSGKLLPKRKLEPEPPIPKHPPKKGKTQQAWSCFKKLCKSGSV